MKKQFLALTLALGLPLLAQSQPVKTPPQDVLKIGVIQSLSGIAAEDGKTVVQALRLAADKINASGTIPVELLIEDDQTVSKNAVTAYQKLRAAGVSAIIGATWDFTTNPLLSLAGRDKLPLFNTSTLPESLNMQEAGQFGFINAISVEQEALPFERFLRNGAYQNLVIVHANNSWGETQLKAYRELAAKTGINVLQELKPATYDENEWRELVPRVRHLAPAAVLLLLNKNDIILFLKRASEIGFRPAWFGSKNTYDAVRLSAARELFENVCFTYPYQKLLEEKDFIRIYSARFGEEPRIYADNTYDALFLIHQAYIKSRDEDIDLPTALRRTEYDGLAGHYRFRPDTSFSTGQASLVCVREGKFVLENQ